MVYFKMTDENGFVSVSTLNADSGGNCTKAEHDAVAQMYRDAKSGYGVIEKDGGFVYAPRPVEPEPPTEEEALTRYANELTGNEGETPDNPIPYNNNMALEEGKYYSQYNAVYVCIRSTVNPVYNDLKDLIDIYVRTV